jgi:PAS domain S-box-containing protein
MLSLPEPPALALIPPGEWPEELQWGLGGLLVAGFAWFAWRHWRLTRRHRLALRRSEERFRRFFEEATVAIIEQDFTEVQRRLQVLREQGTQDLRSLLAANPALGAELFHAVRVTAVNRRAMAIMDATDLDDYVARMRRHIRHAPPAAFIEELMALWEGRDRVMVETSFRTDDGQAHRGILQWTLTRENGVVDLAQVLVVFTDLLALHESEERYRLLFAGATEGVYETLPSGVFRSVNPAMAALLGFTSPAELLAQPAATLEQLYVNPGRRREFFAALASRDTLQDFESEIMRADGSTVWISESVRVVRTADGAPLHYQGFVTDVTARKQAELALRESEARWRLALQGSAAGIWENNMVTGVNFYSDRSKEMLGFAPHEISDRREEWVARIHPEDLGLGKMAMIDHLAGRRPYYQVEHRFRCKDGGYKWILSRGRALIDGQGRVLRIVGTHVDINERKLAEQELRASEARYRTLFELSPIAIVEFDDTSVINWLNSLRTAGVTDLPRFFHEHPGELAESRRNLHIIGANAAALRLVDVSNLPEVYANLPVIMTPDAVQFRLEAFSALWEGRREVEREISIAAKDGSPRRVHAHWWIPVVDGQPQYHRTQLALVDLTQVKSAERALSAERERLSVTLRAMAEGVVTVDNGGVVRFINDSACVLTGRPMAEAIGRPLQQVCVLQHEKTMAPVAVLAQGGAVELPPQTVVRQPDGTARLVEGRCAAMHDLNGRSLGAVLVLRDVTEQSRLETELQRASKLESVGLLAGGIAHDFNNILAIIMGNLTLAMLDEGVRTSPANRWLLDAERGAVRARDLTQQLLTFAKGGEPVRTTVQLPEVVREAAEFALHGSAVRCEFGIAASLWAAEVDKGQIGQVVQNLVINAVQAMPAGGVIRITLDNAVLAADELPLPAGNYLKLVVSDSGSGIGPEQLPRIFEPYFTTKESGIGLGLATVYSIVKKHQGHVTVDSRLGQGTTFRFWLPAATTAAASPAHSQSPFATLRGRVLFMDDEEPIRLMASVLLARLGLEAVTTEDGAEAVRLFVEAKKAGRPFDVVVMDLTVPGGVGGLQAMQQMRGIDPAVRAIVSSGYSSDPVMADYRAHGFSGMVAKPYRITDLAAALRTVLQESSRS